MRAPAALRPCVPGPHFKPAQSEQDRVRLLRPRGARGPLYKAVAIGRGFHKRCVCMHILAFSVQIPALKLFPARWMCRLPVPKGNWQSTHWFQKMLGDEKWRCEPCESSRTFECFARIGLGGRFIEHGKSLPLCNYFDKSNPACQLAAGCQLYTIGATVGHQGARALDHKHRSP